MAASAVGMAQNALDLAVEWAQKRVQFGKPLASFQLTQAKLADMATEINAGRLMTYYAAWLKDSGAPRVTFESSMAKWWCTEMAQRVVDMGVQIYGGYGVRMDYPMQRLYRSVRAPRLYEGSTEIQKLIVCRELLKRYESREKDHEFAKMRTNMTNSIVLFVGLNPPTIIHLGWKLWRLKRGTLRSR